MGRRSFKLRWNKTAKITHPLDFRSALKEDGNGKHDFMGDSWRMTNTTFPVFLMDNIRLWSHGKEASVSGLNKELDCENWLSQCTSFPSSLSFFLCLN